MIATEINNYKLYYNKIGKGKPIVMVHGSLCDSRYWKKQIDVFSSFFEVYSINLRHYWPNDCNSNYENFSVKQHSNDLITFIKKIIDRPVYLLGHSRGGAISIETAIKEPSIVDKLILADPGGFKIEGMVNIFDERDDFRLRSSKLVLENKKEEGLQLFIDTVSGQNTWARMVSWFKQMVHDNAKTLIAQSKEPPFILNIENLSNISMPTLLIGGSLSPSPYPEILDKLQQIIPNNTRINIIGSSHGMNIGNPKVFNSSVCNFLMKN
ncbi:alpha/beta fold hydrolase [Candidatus Kinetoplastidibacterium crithidiae]|uniref:Alpha/beta hydrolase fold protein n=1 Tax=Candidatus Kinetoplastidibacterium crithidiae TCC036E TaxID=1208918 RepID=M1LUU7_9PROT|nr:alpha/beta hydrolase [Candidatus Kinetoplastibacterium crithidii]AFZ82868.1 hydrolase [Candidatus Kinetoplastibacterium crithidii (ex Angomonas deanei ATCC 30255)]AGF47871.1 alpha/beta hydrolase fold protein [Candidatus Kinetoplastibacterium crithidii TCC036E]